MSESEPVYVPPVPPTGIDAIKAKALQLGIKAYMAAPEPVQKATITVVTKTQPVIAKVHPHARKVVASSAALLALRKLARRAGSPKEPM